MSIKYLLYILNQLSVHFQKIITPLAERLNYQSENGIHPIEEILQPTVTE